MNLVFLKSQTCFNTLHRKLFFFAEYVRKSDYISTRSTLTPQGSVASSNEFCMTWLIVSRSDKISARFLVPNTFRRVVAANRRVEWLQSEELLSAQSLKIIILIKNEIFFSSYFFGHFVQTKSPPADPDILSKCSKSK